MLGYKPFYYSTVRNVLLAFGAIFKDIEVIKYHKDTRAELGRITCPLEYGGKETWLARLEADPDLTKGIQISLPTMSYEMVGIRQDLERQQTGFINNSVSQSGNTASQFKFGVPAEVDIALSIYVRNMEDGLQIIEQILPFFTPDYTVSIKYLTINGYAVVNDLPFTMKDIQFSNKYEGAGGDVRFITWTLTFTAQILLYGPTDFAAPIIKDVIVNLRNFDTSHVNATIEVVPNPLSANSTDANLRYTTTITETGPN